MRRMSLLAGPNADSKQDSKLLQCDLEIGKDNRCSPSPLTEDLMCSGNSVFA